MNNDLGFELGLSIIVLFGYIVGKVWIHHKFYKEDTKE